MDWSVWMLDYHGMFSTFVVVVVVVKCRQVPVLEQTPSLGMEEVHLAGGLQGLVKGLSHQGQVLHRG
jgi:hypothetical protein